MLSVIVLSLCFHSALAQNVVGIATAAPSPRLSVAPTASSPAVAPTGLASCPNPPYVAGTDDLSNADWLPPNWGTAYILPGDTVAAAKWASIQSNATYAKALALPPHPVNGYDPVFTGYDANTDPSCWWTDTTCVTPKQPYLPPDHSTCNTPSTWGLTVDDGPLPAHCHLYELYRENGIVPSLFYIGSNVQNNPGSAVEGLALGGAIWCVGVA